MQMFNWDVQNPVRASDMTKDDMLKLMEAELSQLSQKPIVDDGLKDIVIPEECMDQALATKDAITACVSELKECMTLNAFLTDIHIDEDNQIRCDEKLFMNSPFC